MQKNTPSKWDAKQSKRLKLVSWEPFSKLAWVRFKTDFQTGQIICAEEKQWTSIGRNVSWFPSFKFSQILLLSPFHGILLKQNVLQMAFPLRCLESSLTYLQEKALHPYLALLVNFIDFLTHSFWFWLFNVYPQSYQQFTHAVKQKHARIYLAVPQMKKYVFLVQANRLKMWNSTQTKWAC